MRTLLRSLVALVLCAGVFVPALPVSASSNTQVWYLATEDVAPVDEWNGTYYQKYTVTLRSDGTFDGIGEYVGEKATNPSFGKIVPCHTQKISGTVGRTAKWKAVYDNPEAYWYDFAGTISSSGVHSGTGTNVNNRSFRITSVKKSVLEAHRNCHK